MAGNTAKQSSLPAAPPAPISVLQRSETSAANAHATSEKPASTESTAPTVVTPSAVDAPQSVSSIPVNDAPILSATQVAAAAACVTEEGKEETQSGVQQLQTEGEKAHRNGTMKNAGHDVQKVTLQVTAQSESHKEGEQLDSDVVMEDVPPAMAVTATKEAVQDVPLNTLTDVTKKQEMGAVRQSGDDGQDKAREMEKDNLKAMTVDNEEKRGEKRSQPPIDDSAALAEPQKNDPQSDASEQKRRKTTLDGQLNASTDSRTETAGDMQKLTPVRSANPVEASLAGVSEAAGAQRALEKTPAGTGMQLMLRSSPVITGGSGVALESVSKRSVVNQQNDDNANLTADRESVRGDSKEAVIAVSVVLGHNENATEVEPPRREKKVSWAPEKSLVDVKYIDTRVELLRAWDPESEITLPFAPVTLQMLKSLSEHRDRVDPSSGDRNEKDSGNDAQTEQIALKKMTSFEAARKKEHDMELERAKKAREELQKKLDNMRPARPWVHPAAIVLPAECRIDPESIEKFSIVEDSYRETMGQRDPNSKGPPSPPLELRSSVELACRSDADVPLFPLCDGGPEAGEVEDSSLGFHEQLQHDHSGVDSAMHLGYDNSTSDRRGMGNNDDLMREYGHANGHEVGYGMQQAQGMPVGAENGTSMMLGGYDNGNVADKNGRSLPPQAVQHILTALRSSVLNQNNSTQNSSGNDDYGDNKRTEDMDGRRSGVYDDQQAMTGRNEDGSGGGFHSNGGYMDGDGRRGQGMGDGMGSGGGMGMENGGMSGPPPPPFGHLGQLGGGFGQGVQTGGMMEGFSFPVPPIPPPPPMGMPPPNMLPMGMGMPMPPMGLPMPFGMAPGPMPPKNNSNNKGGSKSGKSGPGGGRVETITRPKSKGSKQRKKCKYFGTKQGCRDGSSCVFAHN